MSLKLKALGLSLIAAMAVSAVTVMSATAKEGGHFVTSGVSHAEIKGFVEPEPADHELHLINPGLAGKIGCDIQSYTATTTTETTTSLTVTPEYKTCYTTPDHAKKVEVTVKSCKYTFTVAPIGEPNNVEHTAHLVCDPGDEIEIHHENCTVTVHPQTIEPTVAHPQTLTYTTTPNASPHEITMNVDVQFDVTRHGLCQFVAPTNGVGVLEGDVTVKAFDTEAKQVPLTAT